MTENSVVCRSELENGIRIVTERMPYVRSVSIGVWVAAGVVNETAENNGISHFVEHMLFKGTTNRDVRQIAQSLEDYGGALNGSTGKEASLYTAHILDEQIELAVDVLADLIQNPLLNPDDIELEKNVILSEIRHSQEDPEELLFDHFYRNVFSDHPLGYFIHGHEDTISLLAQENLRAYIETYYRPDRIVFSAAGNVDHQQFVNFVEKRIHRVGNRETGLVPMLNSSMIKEQVLRLNGFQQAHVCIGGRGYSMSHPKKYVLALIDVLLGGGMSSRLFQNIREKYGFTYSVYSFVEYLRDVSIFGTYLSCAEDKLEASIELLKKELEKLATNPVPEEELARLKSQVIGSLLLGLESSSQRMRRNGENEFYNNPHLAVEQIISKINKIESHEILETARELFAEEQLCTTIIQPT